MYGPHFPLHPSVHGHSRGLYLLAVVTSTVATSFLMCAGGERRGWEHRLWSQRDPALNPASHPGDTVVIQEVFSELSELAPLLRPSLGEVLLSKL